MVEYYTLLFIIFAFIQDEVKGVLSSLICFLMIYFIDPFYLYFQTLGFSFYEIMIFYDILFFTVALFFMGSRVGNTLLIVMSVSIILNIVGHLTPKSGFYEMFKNNYTLLNVILFEVLLYMSFTSTIVYPWLVEKFKKVKV